MTSPFAFALLDDDSEEEEGNDALHAQPIEEAVSKLGDDTLQLTLAFVDEFQLSSTTRGANTPTSPPPPSQPQELVLPSPELVSQELLAQVLGGERSQDARDDGSHLVQATLRETDDSLVEQVLIQTGVAELLQSTTHTTANTDTWLSGQDPRQPAHVGIVAPIESTSNKSNKKQQQSQTHKQTQLTKSSSIGGGAKRPTTTTTTRRASNKARNERKEEIVYLRNKVMELEQQLTETKMKQQFKPAASQLCDDSSQLSPSSPTANYTQQPTATASVWQEIVNRQYNQRVRAERENIRLKLVLENQLKIAKSLERVLGRTTSTKDFENLIRGKMLLHSLNSIPPHVAGDPNGGRRLFEELVAGMDQSYAEAESVFEANGLAHTKTSSIEATMRSDESVGIQLEVFANKVLPFDMRTAGSAVWHHYAFAKERLPNRAYRHNSPQTLNATEDTILEDFDLEVDLNSATALFRVKLVLRRFTEENRVVIVWRAFFDPLRIANEPTPGVRLLERGYIVIKESHSATDTVDNSNNMLQTCYIATPIMTGDLVDADSGTIRTITDFMLSATAANISSSHEMIENMLLEHAIKAQYVK